MSETRELQITGGVVLLSAEDYDWAAQFRWCIGSSGYAQRTTQGGGARSGQKRPPTKVLLLHRAIAERVGFGGAPMVDHENRNKLDCTRTNLRPSNAKLNAQNRDNSRARPPRFWDTATPEQRAKHAESIRRSWEKRRAASA